MPFHSLTDVLLAALRSAAASACLVLGVSMSGTSWAAPVDGIRTQPNVHMLTTSHAGCIASTLEDSLLDPNVRYLGQDSEGVVRFALSGGRRMVFYSLVPPDTSYENRGLQQSHTGLLYIGTRCGQFTVVPALNAIREFASLAKGLGATVDIYSIHTKMYSGSNTFIAKPDFFVSPGSSPGPRLALGPDGNYTMVDSTGFSQKLNPAFQSSGLASEALGGPWGEPGVFKIQADATGLYTTVSGRKFIIVPDLTLTYAPENMGTLWQDRDGHYFVRRDAGEQAQGFTIVPRAW